MQGYILNYNMVRDEDLIVTVLTSYENKTLYRFYGARHSIINIGFKIDFEEELSAKVSISRLKDVMHLGFDWIANNNKLFHWQQFIKLLYKHLKEVEELEPFYLNLLDEISKKLTHQSPKRAIIEGYLKLLEHEGRLPSDFKCIICDSDIQSNDIIIVRSFMQACKTCINKQSFNLQKLQIFFDNKNSFNLSDDDINNLWLILMEGI